MQREAGNFPTFGCCTPMGDANDHSGTCAIHVHAGSFT
jgi:hypothetical protein